MTDQDQVNERNCCLVIKGGRLTARALAIAMRASLRAGKQGQQHVKHGKHSIKDLARQGTLTNIEVGENIKSFESIARKYGIDFAVKKDISTQPPKYLVFFKSRDADSMTAAFREFSAKQLSRDAQKPSIMQALQKALFQVNAVQSL
jgi:hypothetical protein